MQHYSRHGSNERKGFSYKSYSSLIALYRGSSLAGRISAALVGRRYPQQFLELASRNRLCRHPSMYVLTTYRFKDSLSYAGCRCISIALNVRNSTCLNRRPEMVPNPCQLTRHLCSCPQQRFRSKPAPRNVPKNVQYEIPRERRSHGCLLHTNEYFSCPTNFLIITRTVYKDFLHLELEMISQIYKRVTLAQITWPITYVLSSVVL